MQVETELVRRTRSASAKSARPSEMASWLALFGPGLRARTAIAVMVMFFQRKFVTSMFPAHFKSHVCRRMEWDQRSAVLWTDACAEHRAERR